MAYRVNDKCYLYNSQNNKNVLVSDVENTEDLCLYWEAVGMFNLGIERHIERVGISLHT